MNTNFDLKSTVLKVRKMTLYNLLLGVIFIIFMIIYGAVSASVIVSNPYAPVTSSLAGATACLIIGLIVMFINILLSILIIVQCSKINASGYVNKYNELGSFLILSILGLFLFGTIIAIILFVMSGNVLKRIDQDIANGTFETNPQPNYAKTYQAPETQSASNKSSDKSMAKKIEEIAELKEKGLIDEAEFKKLKEKIMNGEE